MTKTAKQAQQAIERFLQDADYTHKQLQELLAYEGYSVEEFEEGWSLYIEEAFESLEMEESKDEEATDSILDDIDWDDLDL